MSLQHVLSISTGKDSEAMLALAHVEGRDFKCAFADTGNEHDLVYEHADYLDGWLVQQGYAPMQRVKADFTQDIARKRRYILANWLQEGIPADLVLRALDILKPTGVPFLDLCILKGRFPSRTAQFCTQELKRDPLIQQCFMPLMDAGHTVWSWQGVRLDESHSRRTRLQGTGACVKTIDEVGGGLWNYRPILRWKAMDCFDAMRLVGLKPNPLYAQGMNRVGCMPCINCTKEELAEIAKRWPAHIDRIRAWECLVSDASKRGCSTFFAAVNDPTVSAADLITHETHGIDRMVDWASTSRGGRQYDIFFASAGEETGCSSSYGLCDGVAA